MEKTIKFTKEFFDQKMKKGCIWLKEEYLTCLPDDYIDCVMHAYACGMREKEDISSLCIFDDDQSEKLMKLLAKKAIEVLVLSEDRKKIWDVMLTRDSKSVNQDTGGPNYCFVGGENLRKFCDEKNIYYKSMLGKKNILLSATNFRYLKEEGEDCRIPQNE